VADVARTVWFYTAILGMEEITFGDGRKALAFGQQKINLHPKVTEIHPHADVATAGSADLCFITDIPLEQVMAEFERHDVPIELGPVERTGAMAKLNSIYIRDPDGNLIEISNEV
jgi:catechol 2,3-dioxygenase-like lactoylglutathione lyase family enzyme